MELKQSVQLNILGLGFDFSPEESEGGFADRKSSAAEQGALKSMIPAEVIKPRRGGVRCMKSTGDPIRLCLLCSQYFVVALASKGTCLTDMPVHVGQKIPIDPVICVENADVTVFNVL